MGKKGFQSLLPKVLKDLSRKGLSTLKRGGGTNSRAAVAPLDDKTHTKTCTNFYSNLRINKRMDDSSDNGL